MHYILIAILSNGYSAGGGNVISSAGEYDSIQSCQTAAAAVRKNYDGYARLTMVCAAKEQGLHHD